MIKFRDIITEMMKRKVVYNICDQISKNGSSTRIQFTSFDDCAKLLT